MNCGPLTLTDIDDSRADFEALPDIFMVNIDNGCYVSDTYSFISQTRYSTTSQTRYSVSS